MVRLSSGPRVETQGQAEQRECGLKGRMMDGKLERNSVRAKEREMRKREEDVVGGRL